MMDGGKQVVMKSRVVVKSSRMSRAGRNKGFTQRGMGGLDTARTLMHKGQKQAKNAMKRKQRRNVRKLRK